MQFFHTYSIHVDTFVEHQHEATEDIFHIHKPYHTYFVTFLRISPKNPLSAFIDWNSYSNTVPFKIAGLTWVPLSIRLSSIRDICSTPPEQQLLSVLFYKLLHYHLHSASKNGHPLDPYHAMHHSHGPVYVSSYQQLGCPSICCHPEYRHGASLPPDMEDKRPS